MCHLSHGRGDLEVSKTFEPKLRRPIVFFLHLLSLAMTEWVRRLTVSVDGGGSVRPAGDYYYFGTTSE